MEDLHILVSQPHETGIFVETGCLSWWEKKAHLSSTVNSNVMMQQVILQKGTAPELCKGDGP